MEHERRRPDTPGISALTSPLRLRAPLMSQTHIALLGPGRLRSERGPVRLRSAKTLALLAYLVLEADRPHARSRLAGMLWGSYGESAARRSLRQALHALNTAGEGWLAGCLRISWDSVACVRTASVTVDVLSFEADASSDDPARWQAAVLAYRAPLLEGLSLPDADPFEEWLADRRERLQRLASQALGRLTDDAQRRQAWGSAVEHALAHRALEPTSEIVSLRLATALASSGDFARVEAEYKRLSVRLEQDLGVSPSQQTERAFRQLLESARGAPGVASPMTPEGSGVAREPACAAAAFGDAPIVADPDTYLRVARACEAARGVGQALALCERALAMLRTRQPQPGERIADALLMRASLLGELGRPDERLSTVAEAQAMVESTDDPRHLATVLLHRAQALRAVGQPTQALEAARRALTLSRHAGDLPGQADALDEVALLAWHAGSLPEALRAEGQALALHRRIGDASGEAAALINLGSMLCRQGETVRALRLLERARTLLEGSQQLSATRVAIFAMGNARLRAGDPLSAERDYRSALRGATRSGQSPLAAHSLLALSILARRRNDLSGAQACAEQAVDIERLGKRPEALLHALVELAVVHGLSCATAQGRTCLEEALVWAEFTGNAASTSALSLCLQEIDQPAGLRALLRADFGWVARELSMPGLRICLETPSTLAGIGALITHSRTG